VAVCALCKRVIVDDQACERADCPVVAPPVIGAAGYASIKTQGVIDDLAVHQFLDGTAKRVRTTFLLTGGILLLCLSMVVLGALLLNGFPRGASGEGEQGPAHEDLAAVLADEPRALDDQTAEEKTDTAVNPDGDQPEGVAAPESVFYVDVVNRTGVTITSVYISHGDSEAWGEDLLGTEVLPADATKRFDLPGYPTPIFDIRMMDEDGDTYTFASFDVSRNDIEVTLDNIDAD
jgi:hypothetical protein